MVYPNPTKGVFRIETKGAESAGVAIEIFNLPGERVYSALLCCDDIWLDVSDKPNGIYFIHINTGREKHYQKLLINK
ncbi:hypothetical protein D3C83_173040 [compost metagenome]